MVILQISDHDWSLVLKYWKELEKHLNHPHDFKEHIDFLNRIIFDSAGQNRIKTEKEKEREKKVDDLKEEEDDNDDEVKIDSKLKTFIVEPV